MADPIHRKDPLTLEEARELVAAHFKRPVFFDDSNFIERPFGWVFIWNDPRVGAKPYLFVDRHKGLFHPGTHFRSVIHAIASYEAKLENCDESRKLDAVFWSMIRDGDLPEEFEGYLRMFPNGEFSALAREKLVALRLASRRRSIEARRLTGPGNRMDHFTFEEARAQVVAFLERYEGKLVVIDSLTIERPFGWVFCFGSPEYAKTRDPGLRHMGDTTIIFNRREGIVLLHAANVLQKIAAYEAMLEKSAKPQSVDAVLWSVIKDCNRPEEFEGYLRMFPDGEFAALAREKLEALRLAGKRP